MRQFVLAGGFLALSLSLFAQDPAQTPAKKTDLDGRWKPTSIVYDDQEQLKTPEAKTMITLVITEGEHRLFVLKDAVNDLHYRLATSDLTVHPESKSFVLSVKQGQKKGESLHGIYELSGEQLRLCYGPAAKPRPTEFKAAKGSERFLETWVRQKQK